MPFFQSGNIAILLRKWYDFLILSLVNIPLNKKLFIHHILGVDKMSKQERNHSATTRTGRRSPNKKKNRWMMPVVVVALLAVIFASSSFLFFQSHFFITAKANDVDISFLSAQAAKEKLQQLNKKGEIIINANGAEHKIELPEKYEITEEFLKENINKQSIKLPINESFKSELQNSLNQLTFEEGTPSQDAYVSRVNGTYTIIPEVQGTVVDKEALVQHILTDVETMKDSYTYDVTNFYQKPAVTKDDPSLAEKMNLLAQKENKTINLVINDQTVTMTKEEVLAAITDTGDVNQEALAAWITTLNQTHGSIYKPITFTNVHGVTKQYINNGSYGWELDEAQALSLITAALNSANAAETVTLPIVGDVNEKSNVTQNYIEVDLNDQKMYMVKNGTRIIDTDVITGRYNKGTATVPGFHTILYKDTDTALEGTMLDGSEYSVPVKYWMPLLSQNGVVTQIGIHDSAKAEYYGNKEAFKTNAGSNGCINTPEGIMPQVFAEAYERMPVIIYGTIYDDAPGAFDKPVDYGTPV